MMSKLCGAPSLTLSNGHLTPSNGAANDFWRSIQLSPGLAGVQRQYYGGHRTLASPSCGVFIYAHVSVKY